MKLIKDLSKNEKFIFLYISLSSCLILFGYGFARSTVNTMFKVQYGTDNLPIALAMMPIAVILMIYTYGKLLSKFCLLYTSPSPRDRTRSRMPSSA